jgi:hypothetical protein
MMQSLDVALSGLHEPASFSRRLDWSGLEKVDPQGLFQHGGKEDINQTVAFQ